MVCWRDLGGNNRLNEMQKKHINKLIVFVYFICLIVPLLHFFVYQLGRLDIKSPSNCLMLFKSNNFLGLIIFLNLLIGKNF